MILFWIPFYVCLKSVQKIHIASWLNGVVILWIHQDFPASEWYLQLCLQDQPFFSVCAFLLCHITNLCQISVYCSPCLFQSSRWLGFIWSYRSMPVILSKLIRFLNQSRFLSFLVYSLFVPGRTGSNADVFSHAGFISICSAPRSSLIMMDYSIGIFLAFILSLPKFPLPHGFVLL